MATIHILSGAQTEARIAELCDVLSDCVEGGASLGFMQPYPPADAEPYWRDISRAVGGGAILLVVAEVDGKIAGTVQVGLAQKPNQPHRGDLMKLLVHRSARGRGLARLLMQAAESEAARRGKSLLVLDTATGSPAEEIYPKLGWVRVGVIPGYALWPEGGLCGTTFFYKQIAMPGA